MKTKLKLNNTKNEDISFFSRIMKFNGKDLSLSANEHWICYYLQGTTEFSVALFCSEKRITYFLPLLLDNNQKISPLWPNYIFCKVNKKQKHLLEGHNYIRYPLGPEGINCEKNLIDYLTNFSVVNELIPHYSSGDQVIIHAGALDDFEARISEISEDQKSIKIVIEIFKRPLEITVGSFEILPVDNRIPDFDIIPAKDIDKYFELDEKTVEENINIELIAINDELIRYLSKHPNLLYEISPYKFEELVARIFEDMGYEVKLTPRSRDGGRDIFAIVKIKPNLELLTIIECKRFNPNHKIGLDIVERFLYVLREKDKANLGLIATTSYFTSEARKHENNYKYLLRLSDFDKIREWLSAYGNWSRTESSGLWLPKVSLHSNLDLFQEKINFPKELLVSDYQ